MKRFPILGTLLLLPAFALVVTVGCQKPADKSPTPTGGKSPTAAADLKAIDGAPEGVVLGTVKVKSPPAAKPEAAIAAHKEKDQCMKGGGKHVLEQTWLVADGLVENVVVTLEAPSGKKFAPDQKTKDAWEKKEAILDQPYCAYVPHVVALWADVQPLRIKNSATFLHNVKVDGGTRNGKSDDPVSPGKSLDPKTFKFDPNPIPVQCSLHGWMNAKIVTVPHPYFSVTNEKGAFKIENVPIGEELTVYVWHESMDKRKDVKTLKIAKGDNKIELELP